MIINLNDESDKAKLAKETRQILLNSVFLCVAVMVMQIMIVTSMSMIILNEYGNSLNLLDVLINGMDSSLQILEDKIAIDNITYINNFIKYCSIFSSIMLFLVSINVLTSFKKLSNLTRTPLFRYIIFNVILCVMYGCFVWILYISDDGSNTSLRTLSVVFCGILSVIFMVCVIYFYYKICVAMREISGIADFAYSFKFMCAAIIIVLPFVIYVTSQILWHRVEDILSGDNLSYFMLALLFISCFIAFIALICFILGIYRIKNIKIKDKA
ncbi:hypothetical protein DCO58_11630 [Helicobacter saguini]|uniref:Uncharacterized protein n=1 Tax=Helicobacter saguini TaxID=1548018 RepID=A0A347VQ64_9HELI|nr:hypothetical protein [Helicobacter saguini]MWV61060.1 hypothetical protein [Helicobacter saguini]MWV68271.1 hypothetical protein [Helicobacter saguini]MWV70264.1 hypothetical protein [Helicobacter saguini]MWV72167.1 hypothetical protein [Helicobacter saguini]TLD95227.1 hypothetical protein LS64_002355 [Helicobacter saguini]